MNTTGSHKVVWTRAEQAVVLAKCLEHARSNPGHSLTEVLRHSQQVLPADRQRKIFTYKNLSCWEQLEAGLKEKPTPPPEPVAPIEVNFLKLDPKEAIKEASVDDLWSELVGRLAKQVGARINEGISLALSGLSFAPVQRGFQNGPSNGTYDEPKRKRKIAIVGLLREQWLHVLNRSNVPAGWELVWYNKEKHPNMPAVDFAIVSRHTPHAWTDQAKAHAGKMFFVDQGVNAIAEQVRQIIESGGGL